VEISSLVDLTKHPKYTSGVTVLSFWTSWSQPSKQTNIVLDQLQKQHPDIFCVKVEAEEVSDASEHFNIDSVPTVLFFQAGQLVDTLKGANPPELTKRVTLLSSSQATTVASPPEDLNERLKSLLNQHKIMAFIKGTPTAPQCGFSRKFLNILNESGVQFGSFNILTDQEVREGLKKYSNWPTYPQLYVNGELVGGLDILQELVATGEFGAMAK